MLLLDVKKFKLGRPIAICELLRTAKPTVYTSLYCIIIYLSKLYN